MNNGGDVRIHYTTLEQLDEICQRLQNLSWASLQRNYSTAVARSTRCLRRKGDHRLPDDRNCQSSVAPAFQYGSLQPLDSRAQDCVVQRCRAVSTSFFLAKNIGGRAVATADAAFFPSPSMP